MARQLSSGLTQPTANLIAAHNDNHRSVVALEFAGGTKPHYDGSEWDTSGVELAVSATLGVPATLTDAVTVVIRAKALFNDHLTRSNAGSGLKIWAHKVVDPVNTVATPDTTAGATETATLLAALIATTTPMRVLYENHRSNHKPDGTASGVHASADNVNILGGLPALSTADQVADALNLLKAEANAHMATAGMVHTAADAVNPITAPNCTSADFDSMVVLANQLLSNLPAHFILGAGTHAVADTFNTFTLVPSAAYPGDLFTLANALKVAVNAHLGSVVYHEVADAGVVTAANASTVASLITLAADIRVKLDAHLRNAPVTSAMRGVA
jgi:hypothetical protein